MDNKKNVLIEKIKSAIIELVHYSEDQIKVNLSDFLSEKLNHDYTYFSNLFSETPDSHHLILKNLKTSAAKSSKMRE